MMPGVSEADLVRVRRAVGAYFRAASALGGASLLMRHAAVLVLDDDESGQESEPDDEFLLDRAATYHEKALLMSNSAVALLSHAERWFADLNDADEDLDHVLREFAVEIEDAADAYGQVVEAIGAASFAGRDTYPQLLEELRGSVQVLSAEAAIFRALAEGELEDEEESEMETEDASDEVGVTEAPIPSRPARSPGGPLFDRRVPDELMDVLLADGAFSWVTALARQSISPHAAPLDLGLRANPKTWGAGHATLYLGTTQVLGVHVRADGLFCLSPHQRGRLFKDVEPSFDEGWQAWQALNRLTESMPAIRAHVEAAIAAAPGGRQLEGRYQAALAKPSGAGFTLVDREVMLAFGSDREKRELKNRLRAPLERVKDALDPAHASVAGAPPPGDKLDALAIDRDGRLLAIEVKPGINTKGLASTPHPGRDVRTPGAELDRCQRGICPRSTSRHGGPACRPLPRVDRSPSNLRTDRSRARDRGREASNPPS